jgi:hypothetical protein
MKKIFGILILLSNLTFAQIEKEVAPPYNIKTIQFKQSSQNTLPYFLLGDNFEFTFDDLYGDESNYYFKIIHCDYDWNPSQLFQNEYIVGIDNQRIIDYENSFNTLQLYTHYRLKFPNQFVTRFKVSGNYMLKIMDNEGNLVFSKRFVLYEEKVAVPVQIKNPRTVTVLKQKHNVEFTIKMGNNIFQNPLQNIKVAILQNGIWDTEIRNIKPQFTLGNDLIYKYDQETQFWAGNEFLYFDTKDIRVSVNNIRRIESIGGLYNTHLFPNVARKNLVYTYFPDANGNFVNRNINATTNEFVESDYSWVYFSLDAGIPSNQDIYVQGWFNGFSKADEYKMEYNKISGLHEKAIMVKQGFNNYCYTLVNKNNKSSDFQNAIDGNFFQTENNYFVLVYYRGNNDRYDRVIGKGMANSIDIIN